MRNILQILTFVLLSNNAIAQITLSATHLDFGLKQTTSIDSLPLTISNSGATDFSFADILIVPRFAYFRQDSQFSIHQISKYLTIKSGQSITMFVRFKPLHNIRYKTQLLFISNKIPGCYTVTLSGDGKYSDTYYDSTFDKYDEDLKASLRKILANGYINLGYNGARDAMYANIDNIGGQVECVYTGRKATFNTRSSATSNNFNCEHTFPQGFFNQAEPMRADIHHLFSTDETANNKRDNDPFGYVTSPTWTVGGSKWANSVFEPRMEQKGASARAMLYFVLRYQDYTNFMASQETLLRNWHKQYPPNTRDISRNTAIFNVQKNRNPLIDHPEMEARISSFTSYKVKSATSQPEMVIKEIDFGKLSENDSSEFVNILLEKGNLQSLVEIKGYSRPWITLNTSTASLSGGDAARLSIKIKGAKLPADFTRDSFDLKIGNLSLKLIYRATSLAVSKISEPQISKLSVVNPTTGDLHFSKDLNRGDELMLLDAFGRRVFFTEINSQLNDIEIPKLETGCYFVVLNQYKQQKHLKIFISQE